MQSEDQAPPELVPETPPAPGQLQATLEVDLRGRPGNFAMRWEPLATYQLFIEVSDRRMGTQRRHDLAAGELFYWQGGAQRSMHDAGYALPQEDFPQIKNTMLAQLEALRQEGWDVMETSAWVRETMEPPDIGIRVRDAHTPYDQSPQPGTHQRHIVDTELQRCPD